MKVEAALVLVLVVVLASVERSVGAHCFSRFSEGQCSGELGEVDVNDCCQNPHYGHQDTDGQCRSCGPPVWSPWSSWSHCNALCQDGVSLRTRTCFGIGEPECEDAEDKLQIEPCKGSCCDAKGWSLWQAWSSCTVSCGEGGVRKRHRVCSDPPECHAACPGPSDETTKCPTSTTCPVHGGWSGWSVWSKCSGSCIAGLQEVNIPTRTRRRSCSNPAPSNDTTPTGDGCPGDEVQVQGCSELPNCPVHGGWGVWSPAGKCSTSCGEGLQLSLRMCDQPTPKYGGQMCAGLSTKASACQAKCPVDGLWSGWSNWGECSRSCIHQGLAPVRTRRRSCTNPAPSTSPPGKGCSGGPGQTQNCDQLPDCPVDGGWSSWTPFSTCPVTCGVGLQVSDRKCNNPTTKHGGRPCPGEQRQSRICKTDVHCPVDGVWSSWSDWTQCAFPFGARVIRCKQLRGSQKRIRECLHRAHNGSICSGDQLSQTRVCYNVNGCYLKGNWDGWEPWTRCEKTCGGTSQRARSRFCRPDYSDYVRQRPVAFSGTPRATCGATPDGGPKSEVQPCANLPPCP